MADRVISVGLQGGRALTRYLKDIEARLGNGALVNVGFLEDSTYPQDAEAAEEGKAPLPVAQVAFWNEFGTQSTPARPFIRRMIASKSPRWGHAVGVNLRANGYDAERALTAVGHGIADQMVNSIATLTDPALAPETIARKGFDKPLIDTGWMQRHVDFQVLTEDVD